MKTKTSNKNARTYVQSFKPFKGSNTFGITIGNGDGYAVYSYGTHFPLFVYLNGQWFENGERYSVSTSKHRSQLHPLAETQKVSTSDLHQIIFEQKTK